MPHDAGFRLSGRRRHHVFGQRPQYIAIASGGGTTTVRLAQGMTPEADMPSGSNAVYIIALPQ